MDVSGRVNLDEVIKDCLPDIRKLAIGKYAVTIGGSQGKGLADTQSDIDFRIYAEEINRDFYPAVKNFEAKWLERRVCIDGVWCRTIAEIDKFLEHLLDGIIEVIPKEWTVWGYYMPTDIFNQMIVEDPYGIASAWKRLLVPFPKKYQEALIKKHSSRLRFFRNDYHYKGKVERGDVIFLASMSASLVHDVMQVLFALNSVYFSGDGHNLRYARDFTIKPKDLEARIGRILYPCGANPFEQQYREILALIDDVFLLT